MDTPYFSAMKKAAERGWQIPITCRHSPGILERNGTMGEGVEGVLRE